jgi:hypothetical protein
MLAGRDVEVLTLCTSCSTSESSISTDPGVSLVIEGHRLVFYVRGKTVVKHLFPLRPDSVTFSRQRGEDPEIDWHVRVR